MAGKLRFIYSVMNSGKSLRLLATANDFDEKRIPILLMKPSIDTRDGDGIIKSRAGLERNCIMIEPDINIFKAVNDFSHIRMAEQSKPIKWIFIDECQFLTEAQVDQLSEIVDTLDINVTCYGLRTDFKSKLFPASKRLFELADEIEEIKTMCECGKKASINARFDPNGNIITEGNQIIVGGDDMYKAICRKCWKNLIKENYEASRKEKDI